MAFRVVVVSLYTTRLVGAGRGTAQCNRQAHMTVKATPTAVIRFPLKAFLISLKYLLKTQSLRLLADLSSDAS